tara:strand:- start:182 stop:451 length:270 start_codon:yes stop_codon:yes gene_type:complete
MTDQQIKELIDSLSCIFEDYLEEGISPISVASVMLAVSIKQLQRTLDDDEFTAIMIDLTKNKFSEWEDLTDEEIEQYILEIKDNKRTVH